MLKCVVGTCRGWCGTKEVHSHTRLFSFLLQVSIWPPQKSEETLIFLSNSHLKEHFLNVRHKGVLLLPESGKNTKQVTSKIWSLEKFVIQGVPFECGWTIEHHLYFWLLWLLDLVMWQVPCPTVLILELIIHLASISLGDDVRHKASVICVISVISL